ncbi:hypothetical protein B0T20DRAFT_378775, partial [Sordaria brevicollis]
MDGFRLLAHQAAGLPNSDLDIDRNLDSDLWPPILSFTNCSQPEEYLQEFSIVSWSDDTFSSWGISDIPQSLLNTQAGQDTLTKPMPLPSTSAYIPSGYTTPSSTEQSSTSRLPSSSSVTTPKPEVQAFLRLIRITHNSRRSLLVNPQLFLRIFGLLDLDAHALYLFHTHTPGFHNLNCGTASTSQKSSAPLDESVNVLRFYLSSNEVTTIWSYNVKTRTTLGLCIMDESVKHKFGTVKYHLEAFKETLSSPMVIVCADIARAVVWNGEININYDELEWCQRRNRKGTDRDMEIGAKSSDSIYTPSMELSPALMETLSRQCRVLGRVVTKAQQAKSTLNLALKIAKQLKTRKFWLKLTPQGHPNTNPTDMDPSTEQANTQIRLVLHQLIIPQLKARIFGWTCRQKEATAWTNVLMARISRTDVSTNHREASSMRVIAVMTMAFLPATFFATLFALPAFQWEVVDGWDSSNSMGRGCGRCGGGGSGGNEEDDGEGVIQKSFWVWVAFSVPMTMFVFAVCGVTSSSWWVEGRREWWGRVRVRARR